MTHTNPTVARFAADRTQLEELDGDDLLAVAYELLDACTIDNETLMHLIAPPEGESDVLARWLDEIRQYIVEITLHDGAAALYELNGHARNDEGWMVLRVRPLDVDTSSYTGPSILIPTIEIKTLAVP